MEVVDAARPIKVHESLNRDRTSPYQGFLLAPPPPHIAYDMLAFIEVSVEGSQVEMRLEAAVPAQNESLTVLVFHSLFRMTLLVSASHPLFHILARTFELCVLIVRRLVVLVLSRRVDIHLVLISTAVVLQVRQREDLNFNIPHNRELLFLVLGYPLLEGSHRLKEHTMRLFVGPLALLLDVQKSDSLFNREREV